jgi:DNA-binding IclR family transcriptional regulator
MSEQIQESQDGSGARWTFLTNHAAVLLHIAQHPDDTVLAIASASGLRERTTAAIIADLKAAGYLTAARRGRYNHYSINVDMPLRRREHASIRVKELVEALTTLTRLEEDSETS